MKQFLKHSAVSKVTQRSQQEKEGKVCRWDRPQPKQFIPILMVFLHGASLVGSVVKNLPASGFNLWVLGVENKGMLQPLISAADVCYF